MATNAGGTSTAWYTNFVQAYVDAFLNAPSAATHAPLLAALAQYRAAVERREVAPPRITRLGGGAMRQDN